jgi:hypothetical protein
MQVCVHDKFQRLLGVLICQSNSKLASGVYKFSLASKFLLPTLPEVC